jgi:hypothetical protein
MRLGDDLSLCALPTRNAHRALPMDTAIAGPGFSTPIAPMIRLVLEHPKFTSTGNHTSSSLGKAETNRGGPMAKDKVRGRPFQPGNPGRPRGSKNKVTQWLECLLQDQAEQLVQTVLKQALGGDQASQRMMLERVYPAPKAPPIQVNVPPIKTPQDVHSAIGAILTALGQGRLTPHETSALSSLIGRSIQVIELQDHERRIAALERARGNRNEKDDASET